MSPTSYQLLYSAMSNLVLVAGVEPARIISSTDFKSVASAYSATRARLSFESAIEV